MNSINCLYFSSSFSACRNCLFPIYRSEATLRSTLSTQRLVNVVSEVIPCGSKGYCIQLASTMITSFLKVSITYCELCQFLKQECIPVGCARHPLFTIQGGLYPGGSLSRDGLCPEALCLGMGVSVHGGPPPGKRPPEGPETETPSGRNMGPETETPRRNMGPETETPGKNMGPGSETEVTSYRTPPSPRRNMGPETETSWKELGTRQRDRSDIIQKPPCGQTNASENITLHQTSFAGGKKLMYFVGKSFSPV